MTGPRRRAPATRSNAHGRVGSETDGVDGSDFADELGDGGPHLLGAELLDSLRMRYPARLIVDDRGALRPVRALPAELAELAGADAGLWRESAAREARQGDGGLLFARGVRAGTTVGRAGSSVYPVLSDPLWQDMGLPLPDGFLRWRLSEEPRVRS